MDDNVIVACLGFWLVELIPLIMVYVLEKGGIAFTISAFELIYDVREIAPPQPCLLEVLYGCCSWIQMIWVPRTWGWK